MKKILLGLLLTLSLSSWAKDCFTLKELTQRTTKIPPKIQTSLNNLDPIKNRLCKTNTKYGLNMQSVQPGVNPQHLLDVGLFFGYALIGVDLTYTRLKSNQKYKDHFRLTTNYLPTYWVGGGLQYGKHIKGSIFFAGLNTTYLRLYNDRNSYAGGAIFGISGGAKKRVSGHAYVGILGAYESNIEGYKGTSEIMPQFGFGIKFRVHGK